MVITTTVQQNRWPWLLRWRPQLLPYLAVVHGLLDMATVLMMPTAV